MSLNSENVDCLSFQLRPLDELRVVGACRRGRRRGYRNRTAVERQPDDDQRRFSKNARERQRVENVKKEYAKLQTLLGLESSCIKKSKEKTRHCKLRILNAAAKRIRSLLAERSSLLAAAGACPPNPSPSPPRHGDTALQPCPPVVTLFYSDSCSPEPYAPIPFAPNYSSGRISSRSRCHDTQLSLSRQPHDPMLAINQHLLTPYHLECQPQPPHYPLVPHPPHYPGIGCAAMLQYPSSQGYETSLSYGQN